jgi:uncharacterized membrane protein
MTEQDIVKREREKCARFIEDHREVIRDACAQLKLKGSDQMPLIGKSMIEILEAIANGIRSWNRRP